VARRAQGDEELVWPRVATVVACDREIGRGIDTAAAKELTNQMAGEIKAEFSD
jgi:hypothetical protein